MFVHAASKRKPPPKERQGGIPCDRSVCVGCVNSPASLQVANASTWLMCFTEARRYLKGDCLRTGRTLGKYELFREHRPVQPYVDPTSRTEPRKYVTLIRRLDTLDLLKIYPGFPVLVGVFVVKKKRRKQRLSADARTANQRFLSSSSKSGRNRGFEDEEVLNRQWVGSLSHRQ